MDIKKSLCLFLIFVTAFFYDDGVEIPQISTFKVKQTNHSITKKQSAEIETNEVVTSCLRTSISCLF
jgi:hypothetical protein